MTAWPGHLPAWASRQGKTWGVNLQERREREPGLHLLCKGSAVLSVLFPPLRCAYLTPLFSIFWSSSIFFCVKEKNDLETLSLRMLCCERLSFPNKPEYVRFTCLVAADYPLL